MLFESEGELPYIVWDICKAPISDKGDPGITKKSCLNVNVNMGAGMQTT